MVTSNVHNSPSVAILMATYNGAKFLRAQLDSIAEQTYPHWRIVASDDGSSDETITILQNYQARWGEAKLEVRNGPYQGYSKNFLTMAADPQIHADFYAFCDQDDVWLPTKLAVAIDFLKLSRRAKLPYVYCGRTHYVTETLKPIGDSPIFVYPRSFRNALVQSIAGGNTMVFNQAAKSFLERGGVVDVVAHDWWTYLFIKGVGGKVYYDPIPQILYRQHVGALVGSNNTLPARLERLVWLILGRFRRWNDRHVKALDRLSDLLPEENRDTLSQFVRLRSSHVIHRFRMIGVCGLYRQGWRGTLSLYLAALLKKI